MFITLIKNYIHSQLFAFLKHECDFNVDLANINNICYTE